MNIKNIVLALFLISFSIVSAQENKKWTLQECVNYALENNIERLSEDHRRAKELGSMLQRLDWIQAVEPVETNIVIFSVKPTILDHDVIEKLKQKNISISSLGKGKLRMVTHLDYKEVMHTYVLETLEKITF